MTANPTLPRLISAAEFGRMPNDGTKTELVRGRIVRLPVPRPYHGFICGRVFRYLDRYAEDNKSGTVFSNNSGVITEREPDTVRGADVSYYSFSRLPAGRIAQEEYYEVVPELVVEVRSPSDRWQKTLQKVSECLSAGVAIVVVIDPSNKSANVYRDEGSPETIGPEDTLTVPDLLPGFSVPIARFFE